MTLNVVHRFTRQNTDGVTVTATVPDTDYAELTMSMRTGERPEAVFYALQGRGQIRLYASETERQAEIADTVAAEHRAGQPVAVVVDTREQVSELNAAIRDRLVTDGTVDDTRVVTTGTGQRIGVGDQVATRRNDPSLDVDNRDTWTVTRTQRDGRLTVTSPTAGQRVLPGAYVAADVELAYATTAHGAQGATATTAHLVLGEHTGAASAYVGMTRGRQANTAHLFATDPEEAREQWVTTFTRDRADLGPDHARREAERAAAHYAQARPVSELIDKLRQEWDSEARDLDWLTNAVPLRDNLRQITQLRREQADEIASLDATYRQARETQSMAKGMADDSQTVIAAKTGQNRDALLADWNAQRPAARANARTVLDGSGRLGLKLPAVNRANEALGRWSVSWQPIVPTMPTGHADIARFADRADDTPRIYSAINDYADRRAEARHPEHQHRTAVVADADRCVQQARVHLRDTQRHHQRQLADLGRLGHIAAPEHDLGQIEHRIATTKQRLAETRQRITQLEHSGPASPRPRAGGGHTWSPDDSPTWGGQPAVIVETARINWAADRVAKQQAAQRETVDRVAVALGAREQQPIETWRQHDPGPTPAPSDQGIGR